MNKLKIFLLSAFLILSGCNRYQVPMVANYQQIPVIHVQKNDTLYSLAKRYDTTAEALAKHNGIDDPTELQPGQSLNVPRTKAADTPARSKPAAQSIQTDSTAAKTPQASSKTKAASQNAKTASARAAASKKTAAKGAKTAVTNTKKTAAKGAEKVSGTKRAAKTAAAQKTTKQTVPQTTKLKKPFVAKGTVNFAWPVKGKIISNYGGKGHGVKNDGINISAKRGTTVKAAESGIVVYAGNELKGYGNLILLKHEKNFMTAYAHADTLCVDVGDVVDKGQKIATVGKTGNVKSPQLHFEVRYKTKAVDPKKHLH